MNSPGPRHDPWEWAEVPPPSVALLGESARCEGRCGRLVFSTVTRSAGKPVMVELAFRNDLIWPYTYPVHSVDRCRFQRLLTRGQRSREVISRRVAVRLPRRARPLHNRCPLRGVPPPPPRVVVHRVVQLLPPGLRDVLAVHADLNLPRPPKLVDHGAVTVLARHDHLAVRLAHFASPSHRSIDTSASTDTSCPCVSNRTNVDADKPVARAHARIDNRSRRRFSRTSSRRFAMTSTSSPYVDNSQ